MDSFVSNPERQLASLAYILTRGAEIHPDRIAVSDLLNKKRLTYRELDQRVSALARAMISQGIGKGDLVAMMFNNESFGIETIMATARIGAVIAPVNVRLLPAEVAEYVNAHNCKAIVVGNEYISKFVDCAAKIRIATSAPDGWLDYENEISKQDTTPLPVATSLEDPLRMIPTGGTTGVSKGVVHSHGGTLITILSNIAEFGIGRGWKTLMIAPIYHGAGTDWAMFPLLWRGGTVIFPEDVSFSPQKYLDVARAEKVEFLLLVPAVINAIYKHWDKKPIDTVKVLISTSAPTPPALRKLLAEMFPNADLKAGAGISESLNMAIQSRGEFLEYPNGIGEPHLCTRIAILDENDQPVAPGERGQICLRGFNTALYYHGNAEAGRFTWRKRKGDTEGLEWCFTGDMGVMDVDGRLSIVDRSKDIILTGGETVPSIEIEVAYADHPMIAECAVVGVKCDKWGEAITLVAVRNNPNVSDAEAAEELFNFGRNRLAPYKVPKNIVFLNALPRSHFGKILKRDLRSMEFERMLTPALQRKAG